MVYEDRGQVDEDSNSGDEDGDEDINGDDEDGDDEDGDEDGDSGDEASFDGEQLRRDYASKAKAKVAIKLTERASGFYVTLTKRNGGKSDRRRLRYTCVNRKVPDILCTFQQNAVAEKSSDPDVPQRWRITKREEHNAACRAYYQATPKKKGQLKDDKLKTREIDARTLVEAVLHKLPPNFTAKEARRAVEKEFNIQLPLKSFVKVCEPDATGRALLSLHYLPQYLAALQAVDKRGVYLIEFVEPGSSYSDHCVERWIVIPGVMSIIMSGDDPTIASPLKVCVVDCHHKRQLFGNVDIVAVAQGPNHNVLLLAFGEIRGERGEHCLWFFEHLLESYPSLEVIVVDEGVALNSQEVQDFLAEHNVSLRVCARHLAPNVAKHAATGQAQIVAETVHLLAAARTAKRVARLLDSLSENVRQELEPRLLKLTESSFIDMKKMTGNIRTNQLAECVGSWILNARRLCGVDMVISALAQQNEQVTTQLKAVEGEKSRFAPKAKDEAFKQYKAVEDCTVKGKPAGTAALLTGTIVQKEQSFACRIELFETGTASMQCPCRFFESSGMPCCHLLKLLLVSKVDWQDKRFYHPIHLKTTWKKQLEAVAHGLPHTRIANPMDNVGRDAKRALREIMARDGELAGYPADYRAAAGRPKGSKNADHVNLRRKKPASELASKKPSKSSRPRMSHEQQLERDSVFYDVDEDGEKVELDDDEEQPPASAKRSESCCSSCGAPGHNKSSCNNPDIRRIVEEYQVLPPPPAAPAPKKRARLVRQQNVDVPDGRDAPDGAPQVPGRVRAKHAPDDGSCAVCKKPPETSQAKRDEFTSCRGKCARIAHLTCIKGKRGWKCENCK